MKTTKSKTITANKTVPSDQKESRCNPEDQGGLFFVIQALPPGGEPCNAMVFVTDAQLGELNEARAIVPHVDKREVAAIFILRGLGFPEDMVLGAKCTVQAFESGAEAREAIAHNRAANAEFARLVSGSRQQQPAGLH